MTTLPAEKPSGFEYLSNRGGEPEGLETPADAAAFERLLPHFPNDGACFIARNADGVYGIVVEGSEYPYEGTKDAVDDDWYEGRAVNGEELPAGEFPSLEAILQHANQEVSAVNRMFGGLGADVYWGADTFDGHVTVLAFVPENSLDIALVGEIGGAMHKFMDANTALPAASPKP